MKKYYLSPMGNDRAKSFYGKATVIENESGEKILHVCVSSLLYTFSVEKMNTPPGTDHQQQPPRITGNGSRRRGYCFIAVKRERVGD